MEATIEQLPHAGQIQLAIQVSANMDYSASAARRMVGRFLADEIGYLLRAGEPTLVVAEHICWRVPALLAFPETSPVGTVGTVDVDVQTGQLYITPEQIAEITRHAHDLAANYTSSARPAP
jgi:hypothetical protein